MKSPSFAVLLLLTLLFSCEKSGKNNATIIRNCTGTYLRISDKEYKVCNHQKLAGYNHGISVTATYKHLKKCDDTAMYCLMAYPNDGLIKVISIK